MKQVHVTLKKPKPFLSVEEIRELEVRFGEVLGALYRPKLPPQQISGSCRIIDLAAWKRQRQ